MESLAPLQTYLDAISDAVMAGDWPAYRVGICLPLHLINVADSVTLTTEAELQSAFDCFRQSLHLQRVTDFIRLAEGAVHLDENLISGRYVTHLLAGSHRLIPPFRSQITLRRQAGGPWQAAAISNALANSRWPLLVQSLPQTI